MQRPIIPQTVSPTLWRLTLAGLLVLALGAVLAGVGAGAGVGALPRAPHLRIAWALIDDAPRVRMADGSQRILALASLPTPFTIEAEGVFRSRTSGEWGFALWGVGEAHTIEPGTFAARIFESRIGPDRVFRDPLDTRLERLFPHLTGGRDVIRVHAESSAGGDRLTLYLNGEWAAEAVFPAGGLWRGELWLAADADVQIGRVAVYDAGPAG